MLTKLLPGFFPNFFYQSSSECTAVIFPTITIILFIFKLSSYFIAKRQAHDTLFNKSITVITLDLCYTWWAVVDKLRTEYSKEIITLYDKLIESRMFEKSTNTVLLISQGP